MTSGSEHTVEEIARRGKVLYERRLRADVEEKYAGRFLVVDINTGEYEVADDDLAASDQAMEKNPEAVLYGVRIGEPVAYRLGGASVSWR